jgi:hypothetical protein
VFYLILSGKDDIPNSLFILVLNFDNKSYMKRLLILFALLLGLGGIAYYLNNNADNGKTSLSGEDRNFAFQRDQIGKIAVQKVGEKMQTFTRKEGGIWIVDDKYKVSQFTMPYLLQSVSDLTIQSIPPKNATKNILNDFKKLGIQVKIYDLEGKEVRSYKVGSESHDDKGTYFLMDGSNQPYNMYIKGFDGTMRTRFFQPIDKWRDREIWQYDPKDIVEVGVKYHKNEKESFLLKVDESKIDVRPLSQFIKPSDKDINQDKCKAYLSSFTRIYAEDYDNDNIRKDSISNLIPFATIAVKDQTGHVNEVDFYPFRDLLLKNVNTKDLEEAKKIERFFIKHSKGDFMVVQKRQVKEVFRPYDFFLKEDS